MKNMKFAKKIIILLAVFTNVFVAFSKEDHSYKGYFTPLNLKDLNGKNGFKLNVKAVVCTTVRQAGDINGDGFADILISFCTKANTPVMYVAFGTASEPSLIDLNQLNGTNGFNISIVQASCYFNGIGDINGDGIDDFSIGSNPNKNSQTYVIFGKKGTWPQTFDVSKLNGTDGFRLNGLVELFSLKSAGDINDDGVDDFLLGSNNKAYLIFGKKGLWPSEIPLENINGTNGFVINVAATRHNNYFVSGAGDINADGIDDVLMGGFQGVTDGIVQNFVIFGSKAPWPQSIAVEDLNGTNGFALKYVSNTWQVGIDRAGDFNHDGIDDIIIGGARKIFIVFGRNSPWPTTLNLTNLNGRDGFVINTPVTFDDVSGVKDVNGDNISDILVDNSRTTVSLSFILFGSDKPWPKAMTSNDINGYNGFTISDGEQESICSVSGVGDVNGDKIDDFLIGSYGGQAYVVYGSYERTSPFNSIPLVIGLLVGGIGSIGFSVGGYFIFQQYFHNNAEMQRLVEVGGGGNIN